MSKVKLGISIGDINGIGLEVILKTLANKKILDYCLPIIYGSSKVVSYHKNIVGIEEFSFHGMRSGDSFKEEKINIMNCWTENVSITLGKASEHSGKYAYKSLDKAASDLQEGFIDAIVTAPINKGAMKEEDFPFPGHTEYLTQKWKSEESLMLMVNEDLRIGLVTNHLPIKNVSSAITKEKISKKLAILNDTLKIDFSIERPTIAVLGLNPHAGDSGVIGEEEEKIIRPAIIEAKKGGIMVMGPFPADGFFGSSTFKKYDAILAMYHDQGLIPFKALSFGNGVNYTAGLPYIRTSPDHGTAYEIAGKNMADPSSFRKALFMAVDIVRKRKDYLEMHSNPLNKNLAAKLPQEEDEALPLEDE